MAADGATFPTPVHILAGMTPTAMTIGVNIEGAAAPEPLRTVESES